MIKILSHGMILLIILRITQDYHRYVVRTKSSLIKLENSNNSKIKNPMNISLIWPLICKMS